MNKEQASGWESIQAWLHPTTAGVCWESYNMQGISGDRQTITRSIQNHEEEDGETKIAKRKERRKELSILIHNFGGQCYILSVDDSMSI
jgi:hypothetical protein